MSQPFDQTCNLSALGRVDRAGGQFWVGNPWQFAHTKFNLSAFERNRVFLNARDGSFIDASYPTGADCEGDSRGVAAADLNNDGMVDLLVRQSGGGPLKIYLNRFPRKNFLKVTLRGVKSNSLGLGTHLVAKVGEKRIYREMQSLNTFWAQSPAEIVFGLDEAPRVDRLAIDWPSGCQQVLEGLAANQHVEITEQVSSYRVVSKN